MEPFVRPLDAVALEDAASVGSKNAALGELLQHVRCEGVFVPPGFAVTVEAYRAFLEENGIATAIEELFRGGRKGPGLEEIGRQARELILQGRFPGRLAAEIREAYHDLERSCGQPDVAVRSSATPETLPVATFAGQQESYLHVRGDAGLLEACKKCFASVYTDRSIAYRELHRLDHLKAALSVGVQRMVRADRGAAGLIFTADTESGFEDVVLISASFGLGENVVRGVVDPDEFLVFKTTLRQGFRPLLQRRAGRKEIRMIYEARGGSIATRNVPVSERERASFALADDEVLTLAGWALCIEDHFRRRTGQDLPLGLEWAKDGTTAELAILQARHEAVPMLHDRKVYRSYRLRSKGYLLVSGRAVGSTVGSGPVLRVCRREDMERLQAGQVLVAEMTDPDWVPRMKGAAAVVTERGGRTCHAAIVARELGIPAVVGAAGALERLTEGAPVTVCCAEGEVGRVYEGRVECDVTEIPQESFPRPPVPVLVNLSDPDKAFEATSLPAAGVGLARMEFLLLNHVGVHPGALLRYPNLVDAAVVERIRALIGDSNPADFLVARLSEGIAKIAAAFHPRDVMLRLPDLRTDEYAALLGGREFEAREQNPMLGFRGASRYDHPAHARAFALECAAIRRVREEMGLFNVKLLVPFCRTVAEARGAIAHLERNGLGRGDHGLEIHGMCEVPSNALLAEEFAEVFDGISIGSNDLTQLVLGVDRDSEMISHLFREDDPAVKKLIHLAIEGTHRRGKKVGFCGQAASDALEFADFLVDAGIDSLSVSADRLLPTLLHLAERGEGKGR